MALTLDINGTKAVIGKLDKAVAAIKNPREVLTETGDFLIQEFHDNFGTEGARLDSPWKALALSTLREKQRLGYGSKGILERTGKLMNSFDKNVTKIMVRVFNKAPYFKYHQLGGPNLPQRKMIVDTDKIRGKIFEIFNLFIRNTLS